MLNALTPTVFPVQLPSEGDGILFYHQYGFPQRCQAKSAVVIEDIAHAFFAAPRTGARQWEGEVAIFSLPKFFAMAGLAGGLVISNPDLSDKVREMIRRAPPEPSEIRRWMRQVIASGYTNHPTAPEILFVNSAYELLLEFVRPDPFDLVGFPQSIEGICRVAEQRLERAIYFRSFFGGDTVPPDFWDDDEELLPFALPYFGRGDVKSLERANRL